MSRTSAFLLKTVVVLIALGTLGFLLWEPHVEGVNAHATTLVEIYFDDLFLAYAYIASIPFFVALYQVFTLIGLGRQHTIFAQRSAKALRIMKKCAITMIPLVVIGTIWLMIGESDDRPPIVMMGTIAILFSIAVVIVAARLERKGQRCPQ